MIRIMEEQVMGSASKQCTGTECIVFQDISSQVQHPSFRPSALANLTSCDFYLYLKIKSLLKGTSFQSVESVKNKVTCIMQDLSEQDFQYLEQNSHRVL